MPIFPFYQYPYMNRYYSKNNVYSQENSYNKQVNIEANNLNKDNNTESDNFNNFSSEQASKHNYEQNKSSRYSGFGPIHFQNPFSMDSDEPIIEILGISLYLDDIIILGLLFFLYQEGVEDYMLYLALIMLLLS